MSLTGTLQRRAYNYQDNTILTSFNLLAGRSSELYVKTMSKDMEFIESSVSSVDATHGLITLSSNSQSYSSDSSLRYSLGSYHIEVERFSGTIEKVDSYKESSQNFVELSGRSDISKLFGPIINKDTAFSEDIIYSTLSPYNTLSQIDSTNFTLALGATSLATGVNGADFDILPVAGNRLFTVNGYIGEVNTVSAGDPKTITLTSGALTKVYSEKIYVETDKNYMFNKALSSSHLTSVNPTSLSGSAGKGVFFTSGKEITMSDGSEGNDLVGSSINTNPKAIGYHINSPVSINEENEFQAKFVDEIGSESNSSFDTVNTLIDFEIVNTNTKEGITEIELAPYVPLTLGRQIPKYMNANDNQSVTAVGVLSARGGTVSNNILVTSTTSNDWINLEAGDAIFKLESGNYELLGVLRRIGRYASYGVKTAELHLDRGIDDYADGITIYKINQNYHELGFVNGKHLWAGKFISLPHPKNTSTGLVTLNHVNVHDTNEDISKKFGQPIYKLNSLASGVFNYDKRGASHVNSGVDEYLINTYIERMGLLNFLSEAYKIKPKTGSTNITIRGKTNTSDKHWFYDERGQADVFGSKHSDVIFHTDNLLSRYSIGIDRDSDNAAIFRKNGYENIDNSFLRLFIYINSDILPYSSLRKDSLFNGSKNVDNYNLLLLEDNSIKDNSIEDNTGNRIKLQDLNFQTLPISSSDFSTSSKRFGIMRLTELCVDFLYNPFNPEKELTTKYSTNTASYAYNGFQGTTTTNLGTINIATTNSLHGSGDTNKIHFTNPVSITNTHVIVDEEGNFIARKSGTTTSANEHTFTAAVRYTGVTGGIPALTTGNVFVQTTDNSHQVATILEGENFFGTRVTNPNNKHLGMILPPLSDFLATKGTRFDSSTAVTTPSDSEIVLPFSHPLSSISTQGSTVSENRVLGGFMANISTNGDYWEGTMAVALDRYDVVNGGRHKLEKGNVSGVLKTNEEFRIKAINPTLDHYYQTIKCDTNFKDFTDASDTSATNHTDELPFVVDGIVLGLKLRLWISSSSRTGNATITSSNGNIRKNTMSVSGKNEFLQFVDLTGCYLIEEKDDQDSSRVGTENSVTYMNDTFPNDIIYVISHEIDPATATTHYLITDKELTNDRAYRIMQPNEVCMYDFTPEDITFNLLSSRYTKVMNENKTYNIKSSYFYQEGIKDKRENEGFLSMYVVLDTDKQSDDDYLVIRNRSDIHDDILPKGNYSFFASDGENKRKINLEVSTGASRGKVSKITKPFFSKGIVSFSETFTVQTRGNLNIEPTRACIGTTATIANETEELINELMEENDIVFDLENQDYPLYLAPNYQGVDLFSAINFLLEQKDLTLFEENGTFKIKDRLANDFFKGIVLNETGEYQIFDFEESKNMFNFYNQITVYGRNHKKIRKDIRSINDVGLKAFEVFNAELTTQEDVNKEASALLKLHSSSNKKLKITVGHSKISQIKVGDIINVEIPRENIPLSQYMVLQIEYLLTGLMVLELGKYSKGLEDRFADLIIQNKKINSQLRNESFKESESLDFLEEVKINQLKLFVRKKIFPTTGFPLGFSIPLNTGTSPFGLASGSITYETLVDEELE
jgi:hypothetical protein